MWHGWLAASLSGNLDNQDLGVRAASRIQGAIMTMMVSRTACHSLHLPVYPKPLGCAHAKLASDIPSNEGPSNLSDSRPARHWFAANGARGSTLAGYWLDEYITVNHTSCLGEAAVAGVRTAEGEASNLGGEVCGNHYLSTWHKKALAQKVVSQCNISPNPLKQITKKRNR